MHTIWKFPLTITDEFDMVLPEGATFLSAQLQNNEPMAWFLLDPAAPMVTTPFRIAGTGHPVPDHDRLRYLTTFQKDGLVWHLFRVLISSKG